MTTNITLSSPNGTKASRFSFGTMQFGGTADAKDSRALFEACRDAGITFFDTAHGYTEGRSEKFLGRFAASARDDLVIATKCANAPGSGRDIITAQVDKSRKRLQMDFIDVVYLHRFDPETPLEESLGALAELRDAGKIGQAGLSNFAAWQVMKARGIAHKMGLPITLLQPMYNLVKRQAEVEILPMAVSEGMLVAPYSPLGGGLLTGKYARVNPQGRLSDDAMYNVRYGLSWMRDTARNLATLAAEIGQNPATLAVAWAARNPALYGPIISARSVAQLAPSLAAMQYELSDDLYAKITALSQTPAPATDRLEEV